MGREMEPQWRKKGNWRHGDGVERSLQAQRAKHQEAEIAETVSSTATMYIRPSVSLDRGYAARMNRAGKIEWQLANIRPRVRLGRGYAASSVDPNGKQAAVGTNELPRHHLRQKAKVEMVNK